MLLGLGLAVDYSLLMVNRFREARATGASVADAVEQTGATAGRTVTFSALTVATALSGLFFFGDPTFTSVAIAGIATVLIAMAAALTLIPALLAAWGRKLGAKARQDASDGWFGRLARTVQARPALAAVAVAGLLAAAALPYLHAHYGLGDPRTLPASSQARQVDQTLLTRFPEGMQADPIQVVARVPASDPAIRAYAASRAHQPGVAAVSVEHGLHGNVSVIDVTPTGSTQGSAAEHLVGVLRDHRPHFTAYVTGSAASLADFKAEIASRIPYAVAWIALATFALLFLMTGSVLIPVKALAMNVLSLGATFGALVWVFQDGHLASLLGFTAFGAIEAWAPVIIFTFAFGLSMDYEVFLLSRIKEAHDEGNTTNDAVANGLQRSGRIITSAALLILIVFLGFAAGQTPRDQRDGPGLGHRRRRGRHPGPLHAGPRDHDPARPGQLVGTRPAAPPAPADRPARGARSPGPPAGFRSGPACRPPSRRGRPARLSRPRTGSRRGAPIRAGRTDKKGGITIR